MFQTLVQAVLHHTENIPEKLAVGFKATEITYAELGKQIQSAAAILKSEFAVSPSDKVMLSAVSKPEYIVILLAIQYLGAVAIPCDKSALEANITEIYHFSESKLLISDARIKDTAVNKISLNKLYEQILSYGDTDYPEYTAPDKDSTAEMLFTTGSTGTPKGVMLTYGNVYAITQNMLAGMVIKPSDVVLIPLPLNHSFGMRDLRTMLYIGGTVVLQNGFTFQKELINNLETYHCTAFVSAPAPMERLYRQMGDEFASIFGGLGWIEISSGSLSYGMKKKLAERLTGTTIYNTWGSTETGGAVFLNASKYPDKLSSLGKPVNGVKLKVVDSNGKEIQAKDINSAGRMILQGDMQMAGYFKLPDVTAQTLVDGWLYTGDMVYTDEDGFVYMLGRADDIINVGGEKVSPVEVENIASEFEQLQECACVGVPDPDGIMGQIPVLFYVLNGSAQLDLKALVRFLAERMEAYKMPQKFIHVAELPRNHMNKLDRAAMQRLWTDIGDIDLMNPVMNAILSRRSTRNFTEQRIPRAVLEMIVRAGIQAPSGHNMQAWHFTVIRNKDKIHELKALMQKVADEKRAFFYGMNNPDAVILISNDRRNDFGIQDSSVAAENIMIAAQSYGIGSVWIDVLKKIGNESEIREMLTELGVPTKHDVWTAIALGYPAEEPKAIARKKDVVNWVE